jgi:hypothetical protein
MSAELRRYSSLMTEYTSLIYTAARFRGQPKSGFPTSFSKTESIPFYSGAGLDQLDAVAERIPEFEVGTAGDRYSVE